MNSTRIIRSAKKLQCNRCGICCKELETIVLFGKEILLFEDIRKKAKKTSVINEANGKMYVLELEEGGCPRYAMGTGCTTYEKRPLVCGSFPMAANHYQKGFGFMTLESHLCTATIQFLAGNHDVVFTRRAIESSSFLEQIVNSAKRILALVTGREITMERIPTTVALANSIQKLRDKTKESSDASPSLQ